MNKNISVYVYFLLGMMFNLSLYYLLDNFHDKSVNKEFQARIDNVAAAVKKEVAINFEVIEQFQQIYRQFGELSPEQFSILASTAEQKRSTVQAIEWIPQINLAQKVGFEAAQSLIYPNFQIKQRLNGELVPAIEKQRYFPVALVEPVAGNESAIGFDLSSSETRMKTLQTSASMGKIQASAGINLVQLNSDDKGFLLFAPIYKSPTFKNIDNVRGFVLGVYQSTNLLSHALTEQNKDIAKIQLVDITDELNPQILTQFTPHRFSPTDLTKQISLGNIAGRNWVLNAQATKGYVSSQFSYVPLASFSLGVVFILLLLKSYKQTLRYANQIEEKVQARTQELQRSQSFIEKLTNSVPILLAYVDHDQVYQFVNSKFKTYYDNPVEHYLKQPVVKTVSDEQYQFMLPHIKTALQGETVSYIDEVRTNGEQYWLNTTYTPDIAKDGAINGFFVSIENYSEQVKVEKQLETYAHELEFNSWALEDAKEQAEQATKLKSSFLANMSHEIRTPLSGVIGLLKLMQDGELNDEQAHYLELANTSAASLLTIINDILDLSKVEAGKLEIEYRPFDLPHFLVSIETMYKLLASEKGIEFELVSSIEERTQIVLDEVRLLQIVNNLISNALKFTSAGKVTVNVSLHKVNDSSHSLIIAVTDTGIGIDVQSIGGLFNAFEQVDASTTRKYGGTGLGLTISKKLANLMNGDLTVESVVGKGSTFTCEVLTSISKPEAYSTNLLDNEAEKLIVKRALLVEDNSVNQLIGTKMLSKLGFDVTVAENGQVALDLLAEENDFDIIFMDCMMPVMDGYEATQHIRQNPQFSHVPIVAMTANAMQGDREKCLEAGMDEYISKPLQPDVIAQTIQKVFVA